MSSEVAPLLSVVVPCYNEEDVIGETHSRLMTVLQSLEGVRFELLYVDDGSEDGTAAILRGLHASDRRIRLVGLSRNFGHQVALSAGLEHATGDAVVVIDADLQDPPEVIPEMIGQWQDGYEVVYGVRLVRKGEPRWRLGAIRLFYRLINRLSGGSIPVDTGDFRLLDRKVIDALHDMPERDRFVRGMVSWIGYRQTAIPYERAPREAGATKYPFWKLVRLAADGIFSFSTMPLKLATGIGFLGIGFAVAGILYSLVLRLFTSIWASGWTLMFIAILFLGGVQLVSLGIIGEYVGRIYGESKRRPLYFVRERLGFPEDGPG